MPPSQTEAARLRMQEKKRKGKGKGKKKPAKGKDKPPATTTTKRTMSPAAREAFARSRAALADFRREHGRNPAKGELRGWMSRGGGGAMPRQNGEPDRTPHVPNPPKLGGPKFQLDREYVVQFEPDDKLALAAGLLMALRLAQARISGEAVRAEAILDGWFGADGSEGVQPAVSLKAETEAMSEMLKVLPLVARKMGFTGEEWATSWNAVAGDTVGILPVGPPVSPGLDAPYPPLRGTITSSFAPPSHLGLDIAAPLGTPVIAPEDLRVVGIKTVGDFGNHVFAVSRRPSDGKFPLSGAAPDLVLPAEGVRVHTFAHLSTFAAGLKVGDEIERGAALGSVGSTGDSTGPHLHWAMKLYLATDDGKVKLTPMDPTDFVPADVIGGVAAARPPSPSWTVVDPSAPSRTTEAPSYSVFAGGDIIFRGAKVVTSIGDIDVLSFSRPDEFAELERAAPKFAETVARFGGGALGGWFGGPGGAAAGARLGQQVGGALDSLFSQRR